MSEEKKYIDKCSIKQKDFENGGSVLNCAFGIDELKEIAVDGWVNITICERREPSENGKTHYAKVDTYRSKKADTKSDDLPF